jgi:hypothetical protein
VLQEGVLLFQALEAFALERGGLRVADGVLHAALAVGVAHAGRVGHDLVVGQGGGVQRVELGLVQVGLEHALLEVVQHDVAAGAAEVVPGLLVQFGPDLLAGVPDHAAEAAPRVAQRGHEQPGSAIALGAGHAGERAFAVVDLHLLGRREAQAVELLGLAHPYAGHEALDGVVAAGKAVGVDEILVDGRGVAAQAQLGFDEGAVGFAQGGRRSGASGGSDGDGCLC